jgi:D-serine dehydratase
LPRPPAHAEDIDDFLIDARIKGAPLDAPARLGDLPSRGLRLFDPRLPAPIATLRLDRLQANSRWMAAFCARNELKLAPHGKTTMSPQLFELQRRDGAAAITVATAQQLAVARHFGFPRAILANQPVGATIDACFAALTRDDGFELTCLADSLDGVAALAAGAARSRARRPLDVLIERGAPGGRAGARDLASARAVARAVHAAPGLRLVGVEAFEGLASDLTRVDALVAEVVETARACVDDGLFPPGRAVTLTAGGSAFFDRVGEGFSREVGAPTERVLRSGCALIHDDLGYADAVRAAQARTRLVWPDGGLEPALELWAQVQSRPEPGRCIVTLGRRDVGTDAGAPPPLRWRPAAGGPVRPFPGMGVLAAINDQHGHLVTTPDSPLQLGDWIGFGVGHPCTTFDKWRTLYVVDAEGAIVDAALTFF